MTPVESQSLSGVPATLRGFPGVSQVHGPRRQVRVWARGTWRRPGDSPSGRRGSCGVAAFPERSLPPVGPEGRPLAGVGGRLERATRERRRSPEPSRLWDKGRFVPRQCSGTSTFSSMPHLGGPGSCWVPRHLLRCARGQIPGAQSWHIPRGIPTGKLSKAQAGCLLRVREVCTRSR